MTCIVWLVSCFILSYFQNMYLARKTTEMTNEDEEITRSARIRALLEVPIPTAISLTPAESNLALDSFKVEANSQLRTRAHKE